MPRLASVIREARGWAMTPAERLSAQFGPVYPRLS